MGLDFQWMLDPINNVPMAVPANFDANGELLSYIPSSLDQPTWDEAVALYVNLALSPDLLTASLTADGSVTIVATIARFTGRCYWETLHVWNSMNSAVGLMAANTIPDASYNFGNTPESVAYYSDGRLSSPEAPIVQLDPMVVGLPVCHALDIPNGIYWVRPTPMSVWCADPNADPASGVGGIMLPSAFLTAVAIPAPGAQLLYNGDACTLMMAPYTWQGVPPYGFGPV